jgi:predicted alpha/beta-hydrolase family hydrolase
MADQPLRIQVPGSGDVSAILTDARSSPHGALVLYAPGAGSSLRDPFGGFLAERLATAGRALLRFQFPYTEAGRSMPDRNPVLEATWRAAVDAGRGLSPDLVVGGRSMGGRIASQVVAQGVAVAGLALFAYPLHPPGRPEQRRDAHLRSIKVPALFCSGDRDTFATPDELREAVSLMTGASLHLLAGADHGFNVLKASGRTRHDVWQAACDALLAFLAAVERQAG